LEFHFYLLFIKLQMSEITRVTLVISFWMRYNQDRSGPFLSILTPKKSQNNENLQISDPITDTSSLHLLEHSIEMYLSSNSSLNRVYI